MIKGRKITVICSLFCILTLSIGAVAGSKQDRKRLILVDSYHKGYNWSSDTGKGFTEALLQFGYFDNREQVAAFEKHNFAESSRMVLKRLWMNTKKKKSKKEKVDIIITLTEEVNTFQPDLIFLGDDNAAQYIGVQFLDTDVPVVFWGVNNTPVKYGLVDRIERPGHNVTGVYQSGYYVEGLKLLKTLVPGVRTMAVLTDGSPTGRSIVKALEHLERHGDLLITLEGALSESNFKLWKENVLQLQRNVDAFFIAQYNALRDEHGSYVTNTEAAKWYLQNVTNPEVAIAGQFVRQGMLCTADDSGYNQGFAAVEIARDILENGAEPAVYPPVAPERGALTVNRERAEMLGITLTDNQFIEKYIDRASVLH